MENKKTGSILNFQLAEAHLKQLRGMMWDAMDTVRMAITQLQSDVDAKEIGHIAPDFPYRLAALEGAVVALNYTLGDLHHVKNKMRMVEMTLATAVEEVPELLDLYEGL